MGLSTIIESTLDPYERKARLWPALLAILPLLVDILVLHANAEPLLVDIAVLAVSCGAVYLLSSVVRSMGKRLEPNLFKEWGGKPTTQLLRHRNTALDSITKSRYHAFLSERTGIILPAANQEMRDPSAADAAYDSAVKWLLSQTRDSQKFSLLLKENVSYGFRRNGLGIKPLGLASSLAALLWALHEGGLFQTLQGHLTLFAIGAELSPQVILALVSSVALLCAWIFFFSKGSVRAAAFTYAETLLRTCDQLV